METSQVIFSSSLYELTSLYHLPFLVLMVSNMSSFMSLNSPLIVLLMYCREVSITLDLTIDAPISPLRAATVEYPPISIKYLQTLFSCLCILFTKDLQVGNMKEKIKVTGGIRQGCCISTLLFKMVTFKIIEALRKEKKYKIGKFNDNSIWLADDATLVA